MFWRSENCSISRWPLRGPISGGSCRRADAGSATNNAQSRGACQWMLAAMTPTYLGVRNSASQCLEFFERRRAAPACTAPGSRPGGVAIRMCPLKLLTDIADWLE